jgi:hypothetical protein
MRIWDLAPQKLCRSHLLARTQGTPQIHRLKLKKKCGYHF